MRAMVLRNIGTPLTLEDVPIPIPSPNQVRVKIHTCGVCRTDLHLIQGELPDPHLPLIPGHQIVGEIDKLGDNVTGFQLGDRVGVAWLGKTCGRCDYCQAGRENLCDSAEFTGYTLNGGYAEYCVADYRYIFRIPNHYSAIHAAPLLCAGLVGYRALRLTQGAQTIGFYGFGASAHILAQVVTAGGGKVFAFVRPGDKHGEAFALESGAVWSGPSDQLPPQPLDAAIIFAPTGDLMITALKAVKKGGIVISAGIHMSDIPSFPYSLLWEERSLTTVANLTRQDGIDFFTFCDHHKVGTTVTVFPLEQANQALAALQVGQFKGAAVLQIL